MPTTLSRFRDKVTRSCPLTTSKCVPSIQSNERSAHTNVAHDFPHRVHGRLVRLFRVGSSAALLTHAVHAHIKRTQSRQIPFTIRANLHETASPRVLRNEGIQTPCSFASRSLNNTQSRDHPHNARSLLSHPIYPLFSALFRIVRTTI